MNTLCSQYLSQYNNDIIGKVTHIFKKLILTSSKVYKFNRIDWVDKCLLWHSLMTEILLLVRRNFYILWKKCVIWWKKFSCLVKEILIFDEQNFVVWWVQFACLVDTAFLFEGKKFVVLSIKICFKTRHVPLYIETRHVPLYIKTNNPNVQSPKYYITSSQLPQYKEYIVHHIHPTIQLYTSHNTRVFSPPNTRYLLPSKYNSCFSLCGCPISLLELSTHHGHATKTHRIIKRGAKGRPPPVAYATGWNEASPSLIRFSKGDCFGLHCL